MATRASLTAPDHETDDGKKRLRSPAYPYVNLETALKRAKVFYDREGRNSAPAAVTATHWNYEAKSSGAMQTIAALMSFGLMQDEGTGEKRRVKLSQDALRMLLDNRTDTTELYNLIKKAALSPKIHQQIWAKWGAGISDQNLRHALLFDWNPPFNEKSVDGFIREYRDTISFAKLTESDKVPSEDGDKDKPEGGQYVPKAGDYVQWEPNGVLQFAEPRRVREICSDGKHVLVEGSLTGLPMHELTLQKGPEGSPRKSEIVNPLPPNKLMQEDVFSLAEGRVLIQWPSPLSTESISDLKDWLKIVERKIARSVAEAKQTP